MGKEFWLAALRADGSAFLAAVSQPGVLGRAVPSCPDWSVGELVRHLGAFYPAHPAARWRGRGRRGLAGPHRSRRRRRRPTTRQW